MAGAGDERPIEPQPQAEQEAELTEAEAERSLGLVGETPQSQEPRLTQEKQAELADNEGEQENQGDEEYQEDEAEEPAQPAEPQQEEPAPVGPQQEQQEERQEETAPVNPQQVQEQQPQQQEQEEMAEEEAPRFDPPSPPREQPAARALSTPVAPVSALKRTPTAATPSRSSRYTYAELKEAQRRCEAKMVETALLECSEASKPQKEIFRAHVTDLCANVFAAALRKYNPESKEDVEPVDAVIAAKAAEMERKLKATEASIAALRKEVPRLAAVATRLQLANERKRSADVLVTAAGESKDLEIEEADVIALRDAYMKTSTTIASANTKLAQVVTHTTETIRVVEQAMKRPKTAIDKAMELSPLKTAVLLNDHEIGRDIHPSTMRTRLAMHHSASKSL